MAVVIDLKIGKLSLQIAGVPEQCVIKELSANRSDQPFDKRMRSWNIRTSFDLIDLQDAQVRILAMILEQRIIIGAEISGFVGP